MALDRCQDINARDVFGYTALYWASLMGHREVVLALLSDNATVDVNKANSIGRTPLHAASASGKLAFFCTRRWPRRLAAQRWLLERWVVGSKGSYPSKRQRVAPRRGQGHSQTLASWKMAVKCSRGWQPSWQGFKLLRPLPSQAPSSLPSARPSRA